jgi:hypothetical protein
MRLSITLLVAVVSAADEVAVTASLRGRLVVSLSVTVCVK